jgi:hypothetical protein
VPWPETGAWLRERLPRVVDDRGLIRALDEVIDRYRTYPASASAADFLQRRLDAAMAQPSE